MISILFIWIAEGPLASFINYGMGRLRPLQNMDVYESVLLGISLKDCAQRCLDADSFQCLSFDYVFFGERSSCHLSKYISAHVRGLVVDTTNPRHNHFEIIGKCFRLWSSTLAQYFGPSPAAYCLFQRSTWLTSIPHLMLLYQGIIWKSTHEWHLIAVLRCVLRRMHSFVGHLTTRSANKITQSQLLVIYLLCIYLEHPVWRPFLTLIGLYALHFCGDA